jgi:signal transduction histidine kinase
MLVLDLRGRIVSLNPAAGAILGSPTKQLLGLPIRDLLPVCSGLVRDLQATGAGPVEISLGNNAEISCYQLEASALKDWRGLAVGLLFMLHDVTEQKQAHAQLLEQQRALAMFSERERLARELHDGIGQVLGYVKLQAQAARDWLAQDQKAAADNDLQKLITVAQEAHTEVREYILSAKSTASGQPGFLPMLQQYLQRFSEHYALRTELILPPSGIEGAFEPTVEAQLLRIIQEALTNVRKHARAQCIQVLIQPDGSRAQVVVRDDGAGFDLAILESGDGQKYGLGFMRERAKEVGGSVEIHSAPGQGTQVVIEVPLKVDTRIRGPGLPKGGHS